MDDMTIQVEENIAGEFQVKPGTKSPVTGEHILFCEEWGAILGLDGDAVIHVSETPFTGPGSGDIEAVGYVWYVELYGVTHPIRVDDLYPALHDLVDSAKGHLHFKIDQGA